MQRDKRRLLLVLSLAFAVCVLGALVVVFRLPDRAVARTSPKQPAPGVDKEASARSGLARRMAQKRIAALLKGEWIHVERTDSGLEDRAASRHHAGPCEEKVDEGGDGTRDETIRNTYDEQGNRVREESEDGTGKRKVLSTSRDEYGEIIAVDEGAEKRPGMRRQPKYDEQGDMISAETVVFSANGDQDRVTEMSTYDANGNLTTQKLVKDGVAIFTHKYSYDGEGRLVLDESTINLPVLKKVETYLFSYDEDSNLTSRTVREPGGERRTYEYDDRGNRTLEAIDKNGDGKPEKTIRTKFDADDNKLEEIEEEGTTGKILRIKTFGYDCWRP